eukprot:Amastigsp_a681011_38.p4 type:complete len:133 gc:universal Amastigsp_a681011_38:472-870(+)
MPGFLHALVTICIALWPRRRALCSQARSLTIARGSSSSTLRLTLLPCARRARAWKALTISPLFAPSTAPPSRPFEPSPAARSTTEPHSQASTRTSRAAPMCSRSRSACLPKASFTIKCATWSGSWSASVAAP